MAAVGQGDVAVGVLGSVVLRGPGGAVVPVGSGRQRRLLAALALSPGTPVGCDALAELVWGDDLPADPDGALQTNVGRLRRLLPGTVAIGTGARTYRLEIAPEDLDASRFTAHLTRAAAAPEPARRLADLDAALALWRGRPFADLDHPAVEPEVARLAGLRADAAEQRAAALLDAGRTGEAAAAADALVAAEALREGAAAVLVRALAAAGRPAEALRAYGRLRAALAAELGLDPSPELRALHEQVLRQEPLVQSPAQRRSPAPALPISTFVGRDRDLAAAMAVLAERRIVTLCGPGGVGKTRLARHVAVAVADHYVDGVVLVDLAAARPDAVGAAVAAALRLTEAGAGSLTARIVEVLAVRRQLLVLDDCEHVLDAAAALVEAVALGAPGVDVLATSREALRVDGEQVLPVAPLPPGPAAALLAEGIGAAGLSVAADGADAATVERICEHLDGLPLALELAAARVRGIGLAGLLDALDAPLEVLRHGRRTAPPRHRSLRDVVAWSYGLLDDEQRTLFARLGVFGGAVEQAAVAGVCGTASALPDLVERSLVVRHDSRYGMLDTLRAYARERLAADPAAPALRARHAAWVLRLVTDVHAARSRPDEPAAIRRFDAHLAEVRRAHAWLCGQGPVEDLLLLGHVCAELGYQRARVDLVRMADSALLAAGCDPDADPADPAVDERAALHPMLPRLLGLSAAPRWQRGDVDGAERRCRRAIALAERLGDPPAARDAFEVLCNVVMFRGDLSGAGEYGRRAVELARAVGDDPTEAMAHCDLTISAAYAGDDAAAVRHETAATELAERMGSPYARGWAAYAAGERRAEAGLPGAAAFLERAVALAEEVDGAFLAGVARHTLLTTAARAGDPATAPSRFEPLIDTWHGMGSWTQLWIAVRALAEALSRHGRHRDAAVLVGALRASPRATAEYGADSTRVRAVVDAAAAALGPELDRAMAEGAALGDTGAVALARRLAGGAATGEPARHPVAARR
ncbi:BTAD domain-containing putative transcriptional regulator [Pseudonocardia aurantiaca]|uniref:BTAD domain-containing putative transcriptional regulator n=1 Tax=Pseudonocardia aurantiaca TaxID=75290 RepID=A0ABW4FVM9_9PSEU